VALQEFNTCVTQDPNHSLSYLYAAMTNLSVLDVVPSRSTEAMVLLRATQELLQAYARTMKTKQVSSEQISVVCVR
jgi:hypothetical protein